MERQRLTYLLNQYINRSATPAELEELDQFNLQTAENRELMAEILAEGLADHHEPGFDSSPYLGLSQKVLMIDKEIPEPDAAEKNTALIRPVHFLRKWGWAAAIIVVLCTAVYFWTNTRKIPPSLTNTDLSSVVDVNPGGNKAELRLADGTVITLDSAANGAIAQQGNSSIVKLANGELVYDLKGISKGEVMINTMTTPNGGQYQLTLPDKTKVWMNAASSISFPAVFVGTTRQVKVSGEVYFEVAQDKERPFMVDVDGTSMVQVLGTSFNVNAYRDDNSISTTLLQGSIKVLQDAGNSIILQPGQQSVQSGNAAIQLQAVNVDQVMAWKNGYFSFDNTGLRQMARQLERWYDIRIEFQGNIPEITLKGEMDRGVKLADMIRFLDDYGIAASLQGRTLTLKTK